ncbi:hypothetical protein [Hymenobacter lucidus]|nr:hypothetical protein [Hymenobacter lucidus]
MMLSFISAKLLEPEPADELRDQLTYLWAMSDHYLLLTEST